MKHVKRITVAKADTTSTWDEIANFFEGIWDEILTFFGKGDK